MSLQQRLGNFLLIIGLISLFIFWADFFTSGAIEHFAPLVVGIVALWWGGSLRTRRRPAAEAEDEPPPPKPAPAAKTGGPLRGLLKPKAKPAPAAPPKPAAPPPPPPKKGLAGLLAPRKKK